MVRGTSFLTRGFDTSPAGPPPHLTRGLLPPPKSPLSRGLGAQHPLSWDTKKKVIFRLDLMRFWGWFGCDIKLSVPIFWAIVEIMAWVGHSWSEMMNEVGGTLWGSFILKCRWIAGLTLMKWMSSFDPVEMSSMINDSIVLDRAKPIAWLRGGKKKTNSWCVSLP